MHPGKHGFTLIEIAIVLVIVGLLASGILVGASLIHSAEVMAQVGQIQKLQTAVNTFRTKFNCLPGDCATATDYGFGTTSTDNGDGNGIIEPDVAGDRMASKEPVNFWYHLSSANLVDGNFPIWAGGFPNLYIPGINSPPLKMHAMGINQRLGGGSDFYNAAGGVWVLAHNQFQDTLLPGVRNAWFLTTSTADLQWFGVYVPQDAYAVDAKIDDGYPLSGAVAVLGGYYLGTMSPFYYTSGGFADACVDNSVTPAAYNADITEPTISSICSPLIKGQF